MSLYVKENYMKQWSGMKLILHYSWKCKLYSFNINDSLFPGPSLLIQKQNGVSILQGILTDELLVLFIKTVALVLDKKLSLFCVSENLSYILYMCLHQEDFRNIQNNQAQNCTA